MPVLGKEVERQYIPDELAVKEVENYVERVERQSERSASDAQTQDSTVKPNAQAQSQSTTSQSGNVAVVINKPINLPLDQSQISDGTKKGVFEGVKWLAEWCIMMIKKYPGRVFYSPPGQT